MDKPNRDPFLGGWKPQSFDGSLSVSKNAEGLYYVQAGGETFGPLERDDAWKNLKGADGCLSLHGRAGRLFGLFRDDMGTYQTLAAFRELADPVNDPICGEDSDLFEKMLARDFQLQTMRVNDLKQPAHEKDWIGIRRSNLRGGYRIGRLDGALFEEFDQLCPDAANGSLNSRSFQEKGTLRSVTLWDQPGQNPRLFSMVAVGRAAMEMVRNAPDSDLPDLARGLGLLPFELAALLKIPDLQGAPGDPLIVWGADDGGG